MIQSARPSSPNNDLAYGRLTYAEHSCYARHRASASSVEGLNLRHLLKGKFWGSNSHVAKVATRKAFRVGARAISIARSRISSGRYLGAASLTALANLVVYIVQVCANPKVVRINARRIITGMADAHTIGYCSSVNSIGSPVRPLAICAKVKIAVPLSVAPAAPEPASVCGFGNLLVPVLKLLGCESNGAIVVFSGGHSSDMAIVRALEPVTTAPALALYHPSAA